MQFVNFQGLSHALLSNRKKLPKRIDLIVGIPRSGMLPATMLATQLNVPMTDIDGFKEGRIFGHGSTKNAPDIDKALSSDRTVLVIDDTVNSGKAFKKVRESLQGIEGNIVYCAVFSVVSKHPDVDIVLEQVALSMCQWNMMHQQILKNSCVDIDGVLCRNPEPKEDDNGKAYRRFLRDVELLHATTGEIGWLVTGRLEDYREETEAWLEQHGIKYRELVMAKSEKEHSDPSAYKARIYRETGADLFIESEAPDAVEIFAQSKKPVLCIETQMMISDPTSIPSYRKMAAGGKSFTTLAKVKLYLRSLTGDRIYYTLKGLAGRS